jgi:uncharacterized membrane protein YhaH (DUF805 family)
VVRAAAPLDSPQEIFSWNGRLNRRRYFFRGLIIGIIPSLFIRLPQAWGYQFSGLVSAFAFLLAIAAMVIALFQTIKRLHDLEMVGWYSILSLIPLVNLFFGIYVLFKKGTGGPNRYGADPLSFSRTSS